MAHLVPVQFASKLQVKQAFLDSALHLLLSHAGIVDILVEQGKRSARWCTDDPSGFLLLDQPEDPLTISLAREVPCFAVWSCCSKVEGSEPFDPERGVMFSRFLAQAPLCHRIREK